MDQIIIQDHGSWAQLTLNNPKALNALTYEMVRAIAPKIIELEKTKKFIFIDAKSDKAFCAGGDVKGLGNNLLGEQDYQKVQDFFWWEYKSDFSIHQCQIPIISWLDGIVMGGGVGLTMGSTHKIMTENTTWSMPEVTIGLYPDVGASYFLNKINQNLGLFFGLTGARLDISKCYEIGLCDFVMESNEKDLLLKQLHKVHWDQINDIHGEIDGIISDFHDDPSSDDSEVLYEIVEEFNIDNRENIDEKISELSRIDEHPWINQCLNTYKNGCPMSKAIIFEQLKRSKDKELVDIFVSEWTLSNRICEGTEFKEGVRALLIDKDQNPKWSPSDLSKIKDSDVNQFFRPYGKEEEYKDFLLSRSI